MTETHRVARADEVAPGERLIVEVKGREVAIFNLDGEYRAYLNWCPHQGGPVCEGNITGRMTAAYDRDRLETSYEWLAEDSTLVCPWHDWEFDVAAGAGVSGRIDLPSYPITVDGDDLFITL